MDAATIKRLVKIVYQTEKMISINAIMISYVICTFLICAGAETFTQFEDIPIESYEPLNHQDDDMDLELLPRLGRSSQDVDDPKSYFFRYMKSLNEGFDKSESLAADRFRNIPKPGGFRNIEDGHGRRFRREAETGKNVEGSSTVTPSSVLSEVIEKHLGKPLELGVLDTTSIPTEKPVNTSTEGSVNVGNTRSNLLINDFIRFKRETSQDETPDVDKSTETSRLKREHKAEDHMEKITFQPKPFDREREGRGATKEEWTKQPYLIRRNDDTPYDDNAPASSENVRAPRVHFVTQRRLEAAVPRSYEREARSRDIGRDYPRDYERDVDYNQQRYSRFYNPQSNYYRNDPYYNRYDGPKDRYDPRYDYNYYDRERSYKPKRIIYYATLPDITRTPPNVDLRDRYNYGDRYDDRINPYGDRYHSKLVPKSRYETLVRNKDQYPLKVSTDVNVKEIKKNPERRIYSEVDRNRYAYQDRH